MPRHFAWQARTWRHLHWFCVAGVALGDNITAFCLAGVPLTALGRLWWRAWTGSVAGDAAALCVAGVALGDIYFGFAWQAWHLVTSTFVLRGRRGTYGTGLALVARLGRFWSPVTRGHFAWQAWHLVTSTFVSRSFTHTIFYTPSLAPNFYTPSLKPNFVTHHV